MGSNAGPKIPKVENIVFHIDALNTKSYPGSGNTWSDLSVSGIAGTKVGTVTFVGGGSTASFNWVGTPLGYFEYGKPTQFDLTTKITMNVFWLNRGWNAATWQALFTKGDDSYRISRDATAADRGWYAVGVNPNTYWQTGIATSQPYDVWQMVTCTFDQASNNLIFYNNGIATTNTTRASALNVSTYNFWVGANSQTGGRSPNGNIAIVQLFDTPLSATEVQDLYASFKGRYGLT